MEDYLGIGYEIVLHSLESMEHSVIAIANGHYTNRHEGSPITDLALDMLRSIQQEDGKSLYFPIFPATAAANRCAPLPSLSMVKTAGPLACCVSTFI